MLLGMNYFVRVNCLSFKENILLWHFGFPEILLHKFCNLIQICYHNTLCKENMLKKKKNQNFKQISDCNSINLDHFSTLNQWMNNYVFKRGFTYGVHK